MKNNCEELDGVVGAYLRGQVTNDLAAKLLPPGLKKRVFEWSCLLKLGVAKANDVAWLSVVNRKASKASNFCSFT